MTTLTRSLGFLALFAVLHVTVLHATPASAQTKESPRKKVSEGLIAQADNQIAVRGHELARIQIRLVGRRVAPASSNRRSGVLIEVSAGTLDSPSKRKASAAVYLEQGVVTDFPLTFIDGKTTKNATATLKVLSVTHREVMIEYLQKGETYSIH